MTKNLTSTDTLALEAIANDIKGAVNAVFAICIAMECGHSAAKSYTDGLYFVHDALCGQTEKLCEIIGVDSPGGKRIGEEKHD